MAGIMVRGRRPVILSLPDNKIIELYLSGVSGSELGRRLGVSSSTIHRRLRGYDIKRRTAVEATALRTRRELPITGKFLSLVDGLVLGTRGLR